MEVAIVLDPAYSDLEQLADKMPIWAVDSESNRVVAKRLWELHGSADAHQGITLFRVIDEEDTGSNCVRIIGQVDLHHGVDSSGSEVSEVRVIGARPSKEIREEFSAYGLAAFELTPEGFIAKSK